MNDRFSSRDKHYDKLLGKTLTQLLSIPFHHKKRVFVQKLSTYVA